MSWMFWELLVFVRIPDFREPLNGSKQLGKKLVVLAEGSEMKKVQIWQKDKVKCDCSNCSNILAGC